MLKFFKNLNLNQKINLIIFLVFAECLLINVIVPFNIGYHDEGAFKDLFNGAEFLDGNFGYIEYLFKYKHFPDFDVREVWGFYNPPFFHIIGVILTSFLSLFIKNNRLIEEILQLINVFALFIVLMYFKKIILKFKISDTAKIISCLIFSFHPFILLFSMMFSTDMFVLMFSLMILYYLLCFYNDNSFLNILKLAFSFGLGMMTKLSVGFLAIPAAYILLVILVNNIIKFKLSINTCILFVKYFIFLIITSILGLYYPVRNYILFKIPFTYIQPVNGGNTMPNLESFKFPNLFKYLLNPMIGDSSDNIWFAAFRSSIFDEFNFGEKVKLLASFNLLIYFLLFLFIIIIFILIKNKIKYFNKVNNIHYFVALILTMVVYLVLYTRFNYLFPVNSSCNFRYISIMLPIFYIFIALIINYYGYKIINVILVVSNLIIHIIVLVYFIYGYYLFRTGGSI